MPTPTTPRLDCYHVHQADGKDSDRIMPVFELSCVLKLGDVSERAADSIEYFGTKLLPLQVKVSVSLALDPPPPFFFPRPSSLYALALTHLTPGVKTCCLFFSLSAATLALPFVAFSCLRPLPARASSG